LKAGTVTGPVPTLPPNGLTSMVADTTVTQGFYRMGGYRVSGKRAVRVDMLERLADLIRDRLFWKPRIPEEQRPAGSFEGGGFTVVPDMMSVVGCSGEDFQDILTSLGYRSQIRQVAKVNQVPQAKPAVVDVMPEAVEAAAEPLVEQHAAVVIEEQPVAVEDAPAPEMIEVAVWWPKDMGPFKVRAPRPDKPKFDKAKFAKPANDSGKPHKKRFDKTDRKPERSQPERPQRPEKPMDPNSPFAALAALKASMGKGNG
jgi:ATP-dependent RNA helicase SUPV3L1/SUV3